MPPTPPGALPVIGEGMTVRFKLGALVASVMFLIGTTISGTAFYFTLTSWMRTVDIRFGRLEKALGIDDESQVQGPINTHGKIP